MTFKVFSINVYYGDIMNEAIKNVHIIRWNEIPDFPLYMDQVMSLIEQSLSFLILDEKDKVITSTMINNYVKSKIVSAPVKKKYTREHVAYFIVICLLKKVYSLQEISKLIKVQFDTAPIDAAYDGFCDTFEDALKGVSENHVEYTVDQKTQDLFVKTIMSVVYTIYVQRMIHDEMTVMDAIKDMEKQQKKEKKKK